MDESLIDEAIRHLRNKGAVRKKKDGTSIPTHTLLPQLGDVFRQICEHTGGVSLYTVAGREIPPIARTMSLRGFAAESRADGQTAEKIIEDRINEMINKKTVPKLLPAFIEWMERRDRERLYDFLSASGFDIQGRSGFVAPDAIGPAGHQGISSYDLSDAIAMATQRVVLVAQNHRHMMTAKLGDDDRYWLEIRAALGKPVDVDIVAMHPDTDRDGNLLDRRGDSGQHANVPFATHVMGLYFDDVDDFTSHVEETWQTLNRWSEAYHLLRESAAMAQKRFGRLRIFSSYFEPNTITVIDPDKFSGVVIVSPRTSDRNSRGRPQFVIGRDQYPQSFDYYYRYVHGSIQNKYWRERFHRRGGDQFTRS